MKKLESIKQQQFQPLESKEMKQFYGGLSQSMPEVTITWHKSTGTQTDDGIDGSDDV